MKKIKVKIYTWIDENGIEKKAVVGSNIKH